MWFLFKETFTGNSRQKISIFTGILNLFEVITAKTTKKLCAVFFCFMLAWAMFFSTVPLLLAERFHLHASMTGYFLTFLSVFLGLGVVLIIPRLIKVMRLESIVILSLLSLLLCTILFPIIRYQPFLWLVTILTVAVPFVYIGLVSVLSNVVSVDEQGKVMGVDGSLVALSWGIGPIAIGYIATYGFTLSYTLVGILFLLSLLLFLTYSKK